MLLWLVWMLEGRGELLLIYVQELRRHTVRPRTVADGRKQTQAKAVLIIHVGPWRRRRHGLTCVSKVDIGGALRRVEHAQGDMRCAWRGHAH